jgi:hypothetical protein
VEKDFVWNALSMSMESKTISMDSGKQQTFSMERARLCKEPCREERLIRKRIQKAVQ